MKKISRLSLEHLSEQLQCLSDSEASSLIGGDAYFSPSGAYLGDFGSGDEIIIVTEEEFREIVNRGYSYSDRRTSGNYTGSTSSDAGRSKDSLTDEAKASIAMHYASNYGFSSVCVLMKVMQVLGRMFHRMVVMTELSMLISSIFQRFHPLEAPSLMKKLMSN